MDPFNDIALALGMHRSDFAMKTFLRATLLVALTTTLLTGCDYSGASSSTSESKSPVAAQPGLVSAANETAALARLRSIATAEQRYMLESGGEYATLDTLIGKRIIGDPDSGKLNNYRFSVRVKPGGFEATAEPVKYGVSGIRSFYIDESNVVHAADKKGLAATASDPEA